MRSPFLNSFKPLSLFHILWQQAPWGSYMLYGNYLILLSVNVLLIFHSIHFPHCDANSILSVQRVWGVGDWGSGYLAVLVHVVTALLPLVSQTAHDWSAWPLYLWFPGYRKVKEYPFHFNLNPTIFWPAFFWRKKPSVALLLTFWKETVLSEVSDLPHNLCVANILHAFQRRNWKAFNS